MGMDRLTLSAADRFQRLGLNFMGAAAMLNELKARLPFPAGAKSEFFSARSGLSQKKMSQNRTIDAALATMLQSNQSI